MSEITFCKSEKNSRVLLWHNLKLIKKKEGTKKVKKYTYIHKI
jgi:hypothetical protein